MLLEESTCAFRCTLKHVNGIPLFSHFGTNVIRLPELKKKKVLLVILCIRNASTGEGNLDDDEMMTEEAT